MKDTLLQVEPLIPAPACTLALSCAIARRPTTWFRIALPHQHEGGRVKETGVFRKYGSHTDPTSLHQ